MSRTSSRQQLIRSLLALALFAAIALGGAVAFTPGAEAAAEAEPVAREVVSPNTPPDEGGGGLMNAKSEDWMLFAILLGPIIVLMTGLLLIVFRIDRSEGRE